jgi:hypothetical protein
MDEELWETVTKYSLAAFIVVFLVLALVLLVSGG